MAIARSLEVEYLPPPNPAQPPHRRQSMPLPSTTANIGRPADEADEVRLNV